MHNAGAINPNDVATLSLLGGGYGGVLGRNDGGVYSTVQHNATRAEVRDEGDQSANRDAFQSVQTTLQGNRQEATAALQAVLTAQSFARVEDKIAASALENAKCCCETQKLVMQENEKTRDLINTNTVDGLRAQLAADRLLNLYRM